MADLERYQPSGVLFADVPRMDFANVREQARAAQGLTQALDRISDFAFKRATKQAEIEGQQWAYQNPVTPEQIRAAQESGQPLNLPDVNTYFGGAARGVQAAVLRGDLEMQARGEFARLSAAVDAGLVKDLKDVQVGLSAPIDGFAKMLAQVDPEEAAKFRASMATAGNAVFQNASKRIGDLFLEGKRAQVSQAIKDSGVIMSDIFRTELDPVNLDKRVKLERQRVLDVAMTAGSPEFVRQQMDEFDRKVVSVRTAVLTNYFGSNEFASDPSSMLANLRSGKAGKYAMIWSAMEDDVKADIAQKALKRIGEDAELREREAKLLKEQNRDKGLLVRDQFYRGKIGPDQAIKELMALDDLTPAELKAIRKGEDTPDNDKLIGDIEGMIAKGAVGESDIDGFASRGLITWKQRNGLNAKLRNSDPELSVAEKYINNALGVPDVMTPGFTNVKLRAKQVINQFINEREDAINQGKPFNALAVAQRLVGSRMQQEDMKALEEDRKRLREKLAKVKLRYSEEYTEDDLARADINQNDRKAIMRILKSIRGD